MTSHLERSYFSFKLSFWDWKKNNPTSFTGLVPLAASRQLSSLIILREINLMSNNSKNFNSGSPDASWSWQILGYPPTHGSRSSQPVKVWRYSVLFPLQVSPPSVLLSCSLYPDSDHSLHFAPHPGVGSVKASGWKSLVNSLPSAIFESCMVAHYLSLVTACVLHLTLGIYRFQVPPKRFALQVLSQLSPPGFTMMMIEPEAHI